MAEGGALALILGISSRALGYIAQKTLTVFVNADTICSKKQN
jgi:hypothetical protein